MKILHLSSWYPDRFRPGVAPWVRQQALALSSLAQVAVLAPRSPLEWWRGRGLLEPLPPLENLLEYRPQRPWWAVKRFAEAGVTHACLRLANRIEREFGVPDVIHAHNANPAGYTALLLQQRWRSKVVITEHTGPFPAILTPRYGLRIMSTLAQADAVIGVSPFQCEQMRGAGVERGDLLAVGNMFSVVPPEDYQPAKWRGDTVNLFSVGWGALKGSEALLEAVAIVIKAGHRLHVRVAGAPADQTTLDQVAARGLTNHVELLGQLTSAQMAAEYARCDGLIHTSTYESFSLAVADALGFGKPVVITPCGGPEWFVNDGNGVVADGFTGPQIAEALLKWLNRLAASNPLLIAREIGGMFSPAAVACQLHKIYHQVLGEP